MDTRKQNYHQPNHLRSLTFPTCTSLLITALPDTIWKSGSVVLGDFGAGAGAGALDGAAAGLDAGGATGPHSELDLRGQ